MVRPLEFSMMAKSVDEVAKMNKNKEVNLVIQQKHAADEMVKQNIIQQHMVIKASESIMNGIDVNRNQKIVEPYDKKKKKNKKMDYLKKKDRVKDPNKGRWLDIQG